MKALLVKAILALAFSCCHLTNGQDIDRIFKGWHLYPHEFPWMVKLKTTFPSNTEPGKFKRRVCGGALINDRWVLTARHCVTWHPPHLPGHRVFEAGKGLPAIYMRVYLGSHGKYGEDGIEVIADRAIGRSDYGQPQCSFSRRSSRQGGCEGDHRQARAGPEGPWSLWQKLFRPMRRQRRRLNRFDRRRGRNYRGTFFSRRQGALEIKDATFTNDIALVKLSRRIRFTDKIQPIRLPKNDYDYLGYQCYVSGWGIQSPSEGPSKTLKGAELVVVDGSQTKGCISQSGWGKMCALSLDDFNGKAGAACPGDSGSPLVTYDNENGGWTLIGLLSNGAKSCFKGLPEVYTKVGDYLDWILDTIRDNSVP